MNKSGKPKPATTDEAPHRKRKATPITDSDRRKLRETEEKRLNQAEKPARTSKQRPIRKPPGMSEAEFRARLESTNDNEPQSSSEDSGYDVGYRKPPKHTRFKPGQSGNPKGRPKGSKNSRTCVLEALEQRVPVIVKGKNITLTKREIMSQRVVEHAMKGDLRAFKQVLEFEGGEIETPTDEVLEKLEETLNEEATARILRKHNERIRMSERQRIKAAQAKSAEDMEDV